MVDMKNARIFLLVVVAIGSITAPFASVVAAQPVLGEVTLTPAHPTKLSTIQFDVNVIGEDIKTVKIIVLECNATTGICQNNRDNKTTDHIGGTLYRANITLDYAPATYITYWVYVEDSAGLSTTLPNSHGVKLNLTIESNNGNNSDDGNTGKKQPGFEVVVFIAAVCGALILIGRKRFR
jgi:hypothetical protein